MRMVRREPVVATFCCAAVCLILARPALAQSARELRDRATDLAYNLDHDEAVRLLRQAVSVEPNNAANHRALAATLWLNILFQRNAVTVDNYLGGFSRATVEMKHPPPALDAEFRRESDKAIELAEAHVAAAPRNALAHLDLGAALGLRATYVASVEGRLMAGFRAARRSYDECEQALALDPARVEPGLVVGTYRYIVSTLSLPMRMMAYVAGFGGGKEKGLRMIEEVAARPQAENRTDAQFALVLLYNRERRYADALRTLADLRREYPRNRLVLLETGATALRAGRPQDAEAALNEGLQMLARDQRPRMPGEEALWHLKRGSARAALKRTAEATADLAIATRPDSLPWVQGRAHLENARIALQAGNAADARREAASAAAACGTGNDAVCVEEARKIK
jgi:tetratricopeptide (TPR) repeat protein